MGLGDLESHCEVCSIGIRAFEVSVLLLGGVAILDKKCPFHSAAQGRGHVLTTQFVFLRTLLRSTFALREINLSYAIFGGGIAIDCHVCRGEQTSPIAVMLHKSIDG